MSDKDFAAAQQVDWSDIPVIDIGPLAYHCEQSWAPVAEAIIQAATTAGFFYVINHGIDKKLIEQAFTVSKQFFNLPEKDKASIKINQQQRGWMAQGLSNLEGSKTYDAKEVFFWGWDVADDDPDVLAGLPLVHPNLWPVAVAPNMKEGLLPYYHQVVAMGDRLLGAIAMGLGLPADFFNQFY
jgi:isopenicillin N synthase-like dioxygenase